MRPEWLLVNAEWTRTQRETSQCKAQERYAPFVFKGRSLSIRAYVSPRFLPVCRVSPPFLDNHVPEVGTPSEKVSEKSKLAVTGRKTLAYRETVMRSIQYTTMHQRSAATGRGSLTRAICQAGRSGSWHPSCPGISFSPGAGTAFCISPYLGSTIWRC